MSDPYGRLSYMEARAELGIPDYVQIGGENEYLQLQDEEDEAQRQGTVRPRTRICPYCGRAWPRR